MMTDRDFLTLREDISVLRKEIVTPLREVQSTVIVHGREIEALKRCADDIETLDIDVQQLKKDSQTIKGMWLGAGAVSGAVFAVVSAAIQYLQR